MKTFSMIIKSVLVAGLLTASSVSFALPIINGKLLMYGEFTPINSSGVGVPLNVATGIDFTADMFRVDTRSTGAFLPFLGLAGSIQDLQYDPFSGPIADFWTLPTPGSPAFTFELTTMNVDFSSSTFLNLSGTGIIRGSGFADTMGDWAFGKDVGLFSWTGSSEAGGVYIDVPEPMVLALIGIGLLGFGGLRGFYRGQRVPGKS